ncbi:hypothetical protein [Bosea sp. (in: a-proteobacteria)]|uniref:hypothetical protein n=1 Tax=Bosea sp. (in: a-proteobacteria) TaxID=1871050 RepID=UPI003F6FE0A5
MAIATLACGGGLDKAENRQKDQASLQNPAHASNLPNSSTWLRAGWIRLILIHESGLNQRILIK